MWMAAWLGGLVGGTVRGHGKCLEGDWERCLRIYKISHIMIHVTVQIKARKADKLGDGVHICHLKLHYSPSFVPSRS